MDTTEYLSVSEHFSSIQGEGPTMGRPSIFLRLQSCNLLCGQPDLTAVEDTTDQQEIEKHQSDDATWSCDTISVWLHGEKYKHEELIEEWEEKGFIDKFKNGVHLILTGGEPLLQQDSFVKFFDTFVDRYGWFPYTEIETNCTIKPTEGMDEIIDQYNVSPKLSNSGMPEEMRVAPEVYKFHNNNDKSTFKFVVSSKNDWKEIKGLIDRFDLKVGHKIWLMPAASSRKELFGRNEEVANLAIKHNVCFSTRLQAEIWDQLTGV